MNERLKELAVQAGLIVAEYNGFDRTTLTPAQQKFAELLLTEFKGVLLDMIDEGQGDFDTLDQALTEINDHFGVEE